MKGCGNVQPARIKEIIKHKQVLGRALSLFLFISGCVHGLFVDSGMEIVLSSET
jgi:hypothetical protein